MKKLIINPFSDLDDFFNGIKINNYIRPISNVKDENDAFLISVPLPGLEKDAIKIEVRNNELIISTDQEKCEDCKCQITKNSFRYKDTFILPNIVNQENIEAEMKNGILTVIIQKKEEEKTQRFISIK